MRRPSRELIDEGIVDRAAALFARRGFAKTSVQDVADAVGLSKAGLLHHFPSKEHLRESALGQAHALGGQVLDHIGDLPAGLDRDLRAIEVLVDIAMAHPGIVALLLEPATQPESGDPEVEAAGDRVLRAFGVDRGTTDAERLVRVAGALTALAVLTLAAHRERRTTEWRRHIVATCFDALGHRGPDVVIPDPDHVEA